MIPVFIDTNIYEGIGYNFDNKNSILQAFKKLVNENEIKNIMISVIDGEIISHLEDRKQENIRAIKKHCKWISDLINEELISKKLNKELQDYEEFKKETKTEIIKIDDINSQKILEKYFAVEPPFENKKQNEFKDAFFVEAVLEYIKKDLYIRNVVVTKDEGVIKSIKKFGNTRVKVVKSIQELTDFIINYGSKRKEELKKYIKEYNLKSLIEKEYSVAYCDIEEENIEIDDIEIYGVFDIEILNDIYSSVMVACDIGVALEGKFSCLDYDNSYYSSEEREYLYKSYINKKELMYVCTIVIDIEKSDNGYGNILIRDFPEIEIDYESMNPKEIID